MGQMSACVGSPAAGCGPRPADGAEDIPPGIRRNAWALTAITADLAARDELPKQLVAEATLVIRAAEDRRLHSRPITDPGRACCQQDVA